MKNMELLKLKKPFGGLGSKQLKGKACHGQNVPFWVYILLPWELPLNSSRRHKETGKYFKNKVIYIYFQKKLVNN